MTCDIIYDQLYRHFGQYRYQVQNVYIYKWESDFYCVARQSEYSIEVEVKVSKSDFYADFKKQWKHKALANNKAPILCRPGQELSYTIERDPLHIYHKRPSCTVDFVNPNDCTPNRFWYAMPFGLVNLSDVPKYAGVLWAHPSTDSKGKVTGCYFSIGRNAPLLHKNKTIDRAALLEKFYHQSFSARQNVRESKREAAEARRYADEMNRANYKLSADYSALCKKHGIPDPFAESEEDRIWELNRALARKNNR